MKATEPFRHIYSVSNVYSNEWAPSQVVPSNAPVGDEVTEKWPRI